MSQSDFSFNSQFRPLDFWSLEGPLGILWNWIRNGHNSQIKIYQKISNRNCHPYTKWIKRTRKKEDFQAVGIERTFERMYGNSQALVFCKKKLTQKSDVSFWFSVNTLLFTIPKKRIWSRHGTCCQCHEWHLVCRIFLDLACIWIQKLTISTSDLK